MACIIEGGTSISPSKRHLIGQLRFALNVGADLGCRLIDPGVADTAYL